MVPLALSMERWGGDSGDASASMVRAAVAEATGELIEMPCGESGNHITLSTGVPHPAIQGPVQHRLEHKPTSLHFQ